MPARMSSPIAGLLAITRGSGMDVITIFNRAPGDVAFNREGWRRFQVRLADLGDYVPQPVASRQDHGIRSARRDRVAPIDKPM
jgi:hypothetical protein